MDSVLNILVLGLTRGVLYALLVLGFALIFSVGRVINLAHGAYFFCPIVISTLDAIETVDRSLHEVADVFGARAELKLVAVVIPSALPAVLTGVRVGFGRVFLGVIAGEMLIGQAGLGWSARRAGNSLNMAGVSGHVIVLAAFALIVFKLFDLAVRLAWPWLPTDEDLA